MMVKTRDSNDIYILIDYKTEFFYSKKQNLYLYLKKINGDDYIYNCIDGRFDPELRRKWWLFYGVNNNNNNEMKEIILRDRISN